MKKEKQSDELVNTNRPQEMSGYKSRMDNESFKRLGTESITLGSNVKLTANSKASFVTSKANN